MTVRRLPLISTVVVLLAVATMIGLGIWQLQRRAEKAAAIATLRANPSRPAVAFPKLPPVEPDLLFRPSSVQCLRVVGWREEAGRAADGSMGFRQIAACATGAEGPGALVNVGVSGKPGLRPQWTGGLVRGWIAEEPDHRSVLSRLKAGRAPLRPMLIAARPAPGLKPAAPPRVEDIPDNHLAYAVQWFLFAGVALLIYVLALRRRGKPSAGD